MSGWLITTIKIHTVFQIEKRNCFMRLHPGCICISLIFRCNIYTFETFVADAIFKVIAAPYLLHWSIFLDLGLGNKLELHKLKVTYFRWSDTSYTPTSNPLKDFHSYQFDKLPNLAKMCSLSLLHFCRERFNYASFRKEVLVELIFN